MISLSFMIYTKDLNLVWYKNEVNLKKKMKSWPFMVLQCKFISKGFAKFEVLRQFDMKRDMCVRILFLMFQMNIKERE